MRGKAELTDSWLTVRSEPKDLARCDLSCSMMARRDWSGTMRMETAAEAQLGMRDLELQPADWTSWIESAG